jgi:hypothetical protein
MSKTSTVGQRIAGSVVGLLVGGLAVGGLFLLLFYRHDSEDDYDLLEFIFLGGLGLLIGSVIGAAAGATVVQKFLKQRGSFWRALLGTFAGLLVGGFVALPLSAVIGLLGGMGWATGALIVPTAMVVGAVIGSGWKAKPANAASSEAEPGSSFERQGNDTHCKKCGTELIGPGGPCRKCDDVKTRPCSSCGRHILTNDKTCPYCEAEQRGGVHRLET